MSATVLQTPNKTAPTPDQESPGNWQHPRMQEIVRRREATNFTDKNVKFIVYNICALLVLLFVNTFISRHLPLPTKRSWPTGASILFWTRCIIAAVPILNIGRNFAPLFRKKDDCSDIALTSGQRKLLGLPPTSAPPTPGSVYSTPPRYSRTPSIGSAGSLRSTSGSPLSNFGTPMSNKGSPSYGSLGPGFGSQGSPLAKKAMDGARRSSLGSLGSPSPRASMASTSGASIFGGPLESPSPSPATGKRSSVGLNNKWLYERGRGRRSSGNTLLYT